MTTIDRGDDGQAVGRRGAVMALVAILALLAGGTWLVRTLSHMVAVQDCVASHGRGCDAGDTRAP